jgi:hypothetical protein
MVSTRTATRADVNGNAGEAAPHLTLETTIDLEGNAAPQRLAVELILARARNSEFA